MLVLAAGFEWQGRQYRSLSQIAEAITGAHWSGPRFFGLIKRRADRKVISSDTTFDPRDARKISASKVIG